MGKIAVIDTETTWGNRGMSIGTVAASAELAAAYQSLAEQLGVGFADAGKWNIPMAYAGVHFTEAGHRIFGENLSLFLAQTGGGNHV